MVTALGSDDPSDKLRMTKVYNRHNNMNVSSEVSVSDYIRALYVRDEEEGKVIAFAEFSADAEPTLTFDIPEEATEIIAYALTTMHGLWQGPTVMPNNSMRGRKLEL